MAGGQSAEQAYERVSHPVDAAQAVYNSSLLDLFTLLTERNQKLVLANEEVRKTQAALTRANQSLELRVQERTRDLAATVTRLEQTQSQLLQSEKMAAVGQLAAGVAHEINNPIGFVTSNLGSLSGYVGQLFDLIGVYQNATAALPQEQRAIVDQACKKIELDYLREDIPSLIKESQEGLERVRKIVSGLRDFAHTDSGEWVPADLNQAMASALNVAANEIKYKATVVKELAPLPPVDCIVSQINQVLVNLLVNAAQAIDNQGVITVRSGVQADQVWLEVSDTGHGMPPEVQKRIFEPFYTTKAVGQGTGLGLSITWEIINRHHGHIEMHSAPGKGSTFRMTLPMHQAGS
jgi:signal transduction histidine kinase